MGTLEDLDLLKMLSSPTSPFGTHPFTFKKAPPAKQMSLMYYHNSLKHTEDSQVIVHSSLTTVKFSKHSRVGGLHIFLKG